MKPTTRTLLVGLFFGVSSAVAQVSSTPVLSVSPSHPNPGEQILAVLFYPTGGCVIQGVFDFSQNGRRLTITYTLPSLPVTVAGTCDETFSIGALPAGRYELDWVVVRTGSTFTYSTSFVVGDGGPPEPIPGLGKSGLLILLISFAGTSLLFLRMRQT